MRLNALVVLLALGSVPHGSSAHFGSSRLSPWPQSSGEAIALHAGLRERVQQRLREFVEGGHVPGISAGVSYAKENLAFAAGKRAIDEDGAMQPEDLLCAGSTGKTFVAAVVLQLVQEEKLALDDLAGEYLGQAEWFDRLPNAAELTIENLLEHRSGLPRYEFQADFAHDLLADPDRVWRPEELLSYVFDHAAEVEADRGFAYADTNYIVLGMLVEQVTGSTLYAEIQRRLLEPLELTHVRPQDGRTIPGLVQGHAGLRDPLGFPELVLQDGRFCVNPQFEWAGGGFVSAAGDLARWARSLYGASSSGPTLLSPGLRTRMAEGEAAPELGRGVAYGLGVILWNTPRGRAMGHEGFFPGYLSCMRYWPQFDVAVAVQVNTSDFARVPQPLGQLCDELLELALTELALPEAK